MRAQVRLAWKTQPGHRHQLEGLGNEDAVWVTDTHPGFDAVLVVADGMGGHPRPREASESAVRTARAVLEAAGRDVDVPTTLTLAVERAQETVRSLKAEPAGKPPGTTLSIAVLRDGLLHLIHVGDGSVFVQRAGSARRLAGGEARRAGNRPDQFLGQPQPLAPETARLALAPADRLLLCTDGLTRYFNEAGPGTLDAILGRPGVSISAIAAQLTSHSRPDSYDDDTTVALAEITGFGPDRRVDPLEVREEPEMRSTSKGAGPLAWFLSLLAGGLLLCGGFYLGRLTAPGPGAPPPPAGLREPATPQELAALPPGNLVLFDPLHRRLFALATRPLRAAEGVAQLQGFRVGADGRLADAGSFRLDPSRGELTLPAGDRIPVEVDHAGATLRVLRGGSLQVDSRPSGASVALDGRIVGAAPQRITLPAGRYRLRVDGRTWARETEIEVPAGGAVSVVLTR